MFDVDRFIAECRGAGAANGSPGVLEIVASAVAAPSDILKALGEPRRAGLHQVFRSPELTILNVVWGPRMCQLPHNHKMWAVIGMYTGREDNIFWRRVASAPMAESRPPGPGRSVTETPRPSGLTSFTRWSIRSSG
jgi:predicted metal-dependent enzyme (double-stranded beta helix superfamily)